MCNSMVTCVVIHVVQSLNSVYNCALMYIGYVGTVIILYLWTTIYVYVSANNVCAITCVCAMMCMFVCAIICLCMFLLCMYVY